MAVARKEEFRRNEIDLSDFAKALAHPARIAILATLAERKECICGELVLDLPLAQSTVSQHLKALKEVGLIRGTIDGPRSKYFIDWKVFDRLQKHMAAWHSRMARMRRNNAC